jgi:hypothetical protein
VSNLATDFSFCPGADERRAGRPAAKHSSPDYAQMTVYVRKDVRRAVKIRLFEEGLELSALVEKLLSNWLMTTQADR